MNVRFFLAGADAGAEAVTGSLFDVTQSGIESLRGLPRFLAGVPPNRAMAEFNLSRSAISNESM